MLALELECGRLALLIHGSVGKVASAGEGSGVRSLRAPRAGEEEEEDGEPPTDEPQEVRDVSLCTSCCVGVGGWGRVAPVSSMTALYSSSWLL